MPLIVFEGLDYCGKSTQCELLYNYLNTEYEVLFLREPGGTPTGEAIRDILLDPNMNIGSLSELLLFCASRSQLIEEITKPFLKNGGFVIMDRFFESTLAYQGYGRGIDMKLLKTILEHILSEHEAYPDITFFIDLSPEKCFERANHESLDRMESEGLQTRFYAKTYKGYLQIAKDYHHVYRIDGNQPAKKIHLEVIDKLSAIKII